MIMRIRLVFLYADSKFEELKSVNMLEKVAV